MMFSALPPRNRRIVKATLATAWALSAGGGLSAVLISPVTIIAEIGSWGTILSGGGLAAFTVVAVLGIALNRYWLEWIASYGAMASLVPYLVTVWALTLTGEYTRSTQAFLITSLLAFYGFRAASCAGHAAKLRIEHARSDALLQSIDQGGDDADGDPRG